MGTQCSLEKVDFDSELKPSDERQILAWLNVNILVLLNVLPPMWSSKHGTNPFYFEAKTATITFFFHSKRTDIHFVIDVVGFSL